MTPLRSLKLHHHGTINYETFIMGPYQKDIIIPLKVRGFMYHQIGKRYHDMEMKNDYEMNLLNLFT